MSKIDELLEQYCPNGVERKKLVELGFFYGGLSGKSKADFEDGNAIYITYMNVFSNIEVDTKANNFVKIASNEKQQKIAVGDVLFTGSSESKEECGMSSVMTSQSKEDYYLNSFCFGFRLYDREQFLPGYLKYLFRGNEARQQIIKTASGVTRFNVSKKRMGSVIIPIPPIPVQEEIIRILDSFTSLEAELEAELEARTRQYEYYRNHLLTFGSKDVEWKSLGEVGEFIRGGGLQKKDFKESGVGCIHYGQIYTYYGTSATKTKSFVSKELAKKLKKASNGDLVIAGVSENVEDVCKAVVWLGEEDICISGDAFIYRHQQNPKYIGYLFQTQRFLEFKKRYAQGAKVTRLRSGSLPIYDVPIPPLTEQERIVSILDKFDSLVNDISQGLPAEIDARRKQYEYYRERLLSFNQLVVS